MPSVKQNTPANTYICSWFMNRFMFVNFYYKNINKYIRCETVSDEMDKLRSEISCQEKIFSIIPTNRECLLLIIIHT